MRGRRLNQVLIRSIENNRNSDNGKYKVTQLNDRLDKAIKGIEDNNLDRTDAALSKFVQIGLMLKENSNKTVHYTTIEDKIPYYQSILDQSNKRYALKTD